MSLSLPSIKAVPYPNEVLLEGRNALHRFFHSVIHLPYKKCEVTDYSKYLLVFNSVPILGHRVRVELIAVKRGKCLQD